MKQKLFYIFFMFWSLIAFQDMHAQTMQAGDIAVIGLNADGYDIISFIAFADLPAGEKLYMTDEGWDTTTWGNPFEGHISWTIPAGGISCGTIVSIDLNNLTISGAGGTISTEIAGLNISISGDQILFYQGASARPANPTFITGIHTDYNASKVDPSTGWSNDVDSGSAESVLPTGLTNAVNAVALYDAVEYDNAKYVGTLTGDYDALRTNIYNKINWVFHNTMPYAIGPADYSTPNVTCASACTMTASISAQTNVACNGGATGSLTVSPVNGTAPYTYLWDDGSAQTTATATGLSAGTYEVTVIDINGCIATASATITQPTSVLSASGVATHVSCNGGSNGTVDLTVTGGTAPYTYAWSNTATTEDMVGLMAGTYNVTVTDANGC
ncbi:SprB repeat-containing protein, partial [Winogradskyella sediminis]|uniref:SprB repeat-containing protein n=1 Tax=Winogradskyella sediminis TaxID=1382466 RepID=UPI003AA8B838